MDVGRRVDVDSSVEGPGERVQLELEARCDAEVRACAAEAPEQLRLVVGAGPYDASIRGHELDGAKAVDRQPELPLETADAATERQPGDAGVPDDSHRADEPVLLRRDVELAEERSSAGSGESSRRVDADGVQPREVDDEAAVGRRVADRAVTAAADSDLEVDLTAEANGRDDVVDVRGSDDQRRSSIEHRVPHPSRIVIAGGIGRDDFARK